MPLFEYHAYTAKGKKTKGTLEAVSPTEAKEKLRSMQLVVSDLKETTSASKMTKIPKDALVIFTAQLAQLIKAKIPLYEALVALEDQNRGEPFHPTILSLAERIKKGGSLSSALNEFADSFPPLYRALVSAGEASGNLELVLVRLSGLLSNQQRIAKQLISLLTYPFFLIGLMSISIGILVGFVLPSLETLFEGKELPWFTSFVFTTGRYLRSYWYVLFALVLVLIFIIRRQTKTEKFQSKMDFFLLRFPLTSHYITTSALSRFARALATLLDGGLPLPNALHFAIDATKNIPLQKLLTETSERVIEGKTISSSLEHREIIPRMFTRMVKIGEETGKLQPMLNEIATMYEEDNERFLERAISLAQPILLIVMGAIIGSVILSILIPISSFGSMMQI